MFKVNYAEKEFPAISMFKIFRTKEKAEQFISELGVKFVSLKII